MLRGASALQIGVLGANGSGKSSLLRIVAGEDKDYSGDAQLAKGKRVGYFTQEPRLREDATVRDNILDGVGNLVAMQEELFRLTAEIGATDASSKGGQAVVDRLGVQMDELVERITLADGWDLDRIVAVASENLRCPEPDRVVGTLSGGEKRRVALCKLLLSHPDILLLDEPTNHLDAESVAWLESFLDQYKGMVMCVTHDRYFLDNVAGWILELDRGEALPFEGNYSDWLSQKGKRLAAEKKAETARARFLAKELEWIRTAQSARQKKSKARVRSYDELVNTSRKQSLETSSIVIAPGPRLGNKVIEVDGLSKSFEGKSLFENLSFSLPPGAILGVIGANGTGKTTFFNTLIGEETADSGKVEFGETVQLGYVSQSRDALNPDNTVFQEISGGSDIVPLGDKDVNVRAYIAQFNFRGDSQQSLIGTLSGGERNRVHLAKMLKSGCNVLLLDEPTNDLDVDTLRALEDAIPNFAGSAVVISHDRYFLDRICTHLLAFEGNGKTTFIEGSYSDYKEAMRREGRVAVGDEQTSKGKPKIFGRLANAGSPTA